MFKLPRLSAFIAGAVLSAFALSIGADPARAQQAEAAGTVRTAVETWLKGRYKVDEVRKAPGLRGIPLLWPYANRLDEQAFYANGQKYTFDAGIGNTGRALAQEAL